MKIWTGSWLLQLQPDREVRLLTPVPRQELHRLHLALNLEDDDEQEIFDDPLAVQTEVIKLSSQTLLFALSTTNSNNKDCPLQF